MLFFSIFLFLSMRDSFGDNAKQLTDQEIFFKVAAEATRINWAAEGSKDFCEDFLEGAKSRKIEFIQPILKTNNYKDPKLQSFIKKCRKFKTGEVSGVTFWSTINKTMLKEMEFYATYNFRLYRVDIDHNPANGEEYVFYAEGYYSPKWNYLPDAIYRIVDFEKCEIKGQKAMNDTIDYYSRKPTGHYNGILKYQGRYFIYSIEHLKYFKNNKYDLRVIGWEKLWENYYNIDTLCAFSTIK